MSATAPNGSNAAADRARRLKLDKFFDRHGWNFDEALKALGAWVYFTGPGRRVDVIRWIRAVLEDLEETPEGALKEEGQRERRLRRRCDS